MKRETLISLLVILASAGFAAGIGAAGYYTLKKRPADMPRFLVQLVTTIGGVLATNLGAVIGFSFKIPPELNAALAHPLSISAWLGSSAVPVGTQLQLMAAGLYVIGLLVAVMLWGVAHFSDDPAVVVPTLPELSRTLLGVMVGALAVALGTQTP